MLSIKTVISNKGSNFFSYCRWSTTHEFNPKIREMCSKINAFLLARPLAVGEVDIPSLRGLNIFEGRDYILSPGDCFDRYGKSVTGSAELNSRKPICLSAKRLSYMPPAALLDQIPALIAHEMAHEVGYHEADARLLQSKVVNDFKNPSGKLQLNIMLGFAEHAIEDLLKLIAGRESNEKVCASLGEVSGFVKSAARMGFVFMDGLVTQGLSQDSWNLNSRVSHLDAIDFRPFCGLSATPTELPAEQREIATGDWVDLSKSLNEELDLVRKIEQSFYTP